MILYSSQNFPHSLLITIKSKEVENIKKADYLKEICMFCGIE